MKGRNAAKAFSSTAASRFAEARKNNPENYRARNTREVVFLDSMEEAQEGDEFIAVAPNGQFGFWRDATC